MKRFVIFLFLFPALATVMLYAAFYILADAVVDSLSGPAIMYCLFIVPALVVALVDWLVAKTRVPNIIATTLFAYGGSVLIVVLANVIDAWVFGFVGAIPAAVCSWLSGRTAQSRSKEPCRTETESPNL